MKGFKLFIVTVFFAWLGIAETTAQCTSADIMEPGFNFITSSRGCAPFTIEIQTLYLNSTPGTIYHVDWGDGSSDSDYIQVSNYPNGPIISHEYVNSPVDCGFQINVEVENPCNPLGSVILEPINVIVWTDDLVFSDPDVYRVCEGFASTINFSDDSDWNCFPRSDARENADPRWIQWIYGRPVNGNRLNGVRVDGVLPGGFSYYDPALGNDPVYPVTDIDQESLNVQIPVTGPADVGKDFYVILNNWNTCNPYDEDLTNGSLNPATAGGDYPPRTTESRIVIVSAPIPDFVARKETSSNPIVWDYCVDDIIYFDNESTGPGGSALSHRWEFYDGPNASDGLLEEKTDRNPVYSYATGGQKLVRLIVGDNNAVGGCQETVEKIVNVTPTSIAQISASNTSFCKNPESSEVFTVTFSDVSIGSTTDTEWKWEFYDENNVLIREEPSAGFSSAIPVPYTQDYSNAGVYRVVLKSRNVITLCDTRDEINIVIYNNPEPAFASQPVCEGLPTLLIDETVLQKVNNSEVVRWEWDFDYDLISFDPDTTFDISVPDSLEVNLSHGAHQVALRVTNNQNGCSAVFSDLVEVYQNPNATFIKDSIEGCSPLIVNLQNTSFGTQEVPVSTYTWSIDYGQGFIDTLTSSPSDPDFSAFISTTLENWNTLPKTFRVALKSTSAEGCTFVSEIDSLTVRPSVKPGFYYSNYQPLSNNCSPVEVHFHIDEFTNSIQPSDFTWTIRNNEGVIRRETVASDDLEFRHLFNAKGNGINSFSIQLDASIEDMCVGDSSINVNINPVPIADFNIDTLEYGCDKMVLEIDAVQKGLLEYNWMIDKGGILEVRNNGGDRFVYETLRGRPGMPESELSFTLKTANYAYCESETASKSLMVTSKPDVHAEFRASPEIQIYPDAIVSITNNSVMSNGSVLWDFGDGSTSSVNNPTEHRYSEPGEYLITLSINEDYCESVDTASIFIQPAQPIADFDFNPGKGCAPLTVDFTNLTKYGDAEMYTWYFGESGEGYSTDEHPTHVFYQPGVYSVKLEASNSSGMSHSVIKRFIVEVYRNPHADFAIRPETVKLPEDPLYTTNLSINADSYLWDFGDGTQSAEREPSHVYLDTGNYNITLIARTEEGCVDTVTYEDIVEVIDGNEILIPNAFTPSLDGPTGGLRYGDGRNDVFYPVTEGVIAYRMQIFNRWGELLFNTEDKNRGWDGYYKGKLCSSDVYIYKIDFKFIDGRETMKFGDITLIR